MFGSKIEERGKEGGGGVQGADLGEQGADCECNLSEVIIGVGLTEWPQVPLLRAPACRSRMIAE